MAFLSVSSSLLAGLWWCLPPSLSLFLTEVWQTPGSKETTRIILSYVRVGRYRKVYIFNITGVYFRQVVNEEFNIHL